jgi:hypothetical protein
VYGHEQDGVASFRSILEIEDDIPLDRTRLGLAHLIVVPVGVCAAEHVYHKCLFFPSCLITFVIPIYYYCYYPLVVLLCNLLYCYKN